MSNTKTSLDDLLSLGGDLLSHLVGAPQDLKSKVKSRIGGVAQRLDLVSREEFDLAFKMLAKARDMQEDLDVRVSRLESFLTQSSGKKTVKTKKRNLPSVKTKKKMRASK